MVICHYSISDVENNRNCIISRTMPEGVSLSLGPTGKLFLAEGTKALDHRSLQSENSKKKKRNVT
jgi:hypothetical protein